MATKAQIRDKVLNKLGVLGKGQTATNEDAVLIEDKITEIHANLFAKAKIYWSADDTPDEAIIPWVWLIANECSEEFGRASEKLEIKAAQAMIDIAELNAVDYEGEPHEALYY